MSKKYELTEKIYLIFKYAKKEALRIKANIVTPDILFLGLLVSGDKEFIDLCFDNDIDIKHIREEIELHYQSDCQLEEVTLDKDVESFIFELPNIAQELNANGVEPIHVLLIILKNKNNITCKMFKDKNLDYDSLQEKYYRNPLNSATDEGDDDDEDDDDDDDEDEQPKKNQNQNSDSSTPVLDNFGTDLTKAAEENRLDPIVGRSQEIERMVQILSRRKKNNPVLIGEPGVGKSAIVEGLAIKIVKKEVSRVLYGKRVISLDMGSVVAGTKYRGQFEERIKSIIREISNNPNVILFIDEIHTMVGAGGSQGSLDASNMLKPALARGEIQCIGATTIDEFRKYFEKDGALERRFQKITVEPTSIDETIQILKNIKDKYEEHHNVRYTDEALVACVKLTDRYISDRLLPDKAIDALDEAGSKVHISKIKVPEKIEEIESQLEKIKEEKLEAVKSQNFELAASFRDKEQELTKDLENAKIEWEKNLADNRQIVNEAHVEEVVAMMTGVPVARIAQAEGQRLLQMGQELKSKVIGQDAAIDKIVKAIQRNRAGLKDPNKPIGSFIFLGPTGVGKTQLAKILAEYLFDDKNALIRIDMSEYMEKLNVSRLVGAAPGYVGYEEGGQLTEKVRRKPYSVVLLDEIEKAHADVFNIFLQVLDEGQLTDSLGRKVDFKNTILIMTSNIGARQIQDYGRGVGFSSLENQEENNKSIIDKALKKAFAPEFLNRVDDVIMFNNLSRENIHQIIDVELKGLYTRVKDLGYKLSLTDRAKDYIADKGFDEKYGARPLKRAVQKYLENELASAILEKTPKQGDTLEVDLDSDNKIIINIQNN